MKTFKYKGYGAIVTTVGNKEEVIKLLKEEDFEFEYYYPEHLIFEIDPDNFNGLDIRRVYVGKYTPDLDRLTERCKQEGIPVGFLISTDDGYGWERDSLVEGFINLYNTGGLTSAQLIGCIKYFYGVE